MAPGFRIRDPGFGWAPSKLCEIAEESNFLASKAENATFNERGLLCQFPAFHISKAPPLVALPDDFLQMVLAKASKNCHMRDCVGHWYTLCFDRAVPEHDPSILQMVQQGSHVIVLSESSPGSQHALLMELIRDNGKIADLRTKSRLGICPQHKIKDQMLENAYDTACQIRDKISQQQPTMTISSAAEFNRMIHEGATRIIEQKAELVRELQQIVAYSLEKVISNCCAGLYAVKGADLGTDLCVV